MSDELMVGKHVQLLLETPCYWCDGIGHTKAVPEGKKKAVETVCHHCQGKGGYMTETGEQIMDFVKRNLLK